MVRQKQKLCQYCGVKTTKVMCGHCKDKLELVRQIQQMIRDAVKGGAE